MGEDHFLNLQPGTIVNGRYEIVKCLGTGSMGMVYACRHRELSGHLVAMKVLFTEVARDDVAAARFRNEIVASYGVSHPNVVRAYEYFRDGDLVAFTMEYIGGGDLADKLNSGEPLEYEQILHYLKQMCQGVQAIHDAGIIHRDLKPENILLTTQGDIKITDFGIARTGTGPKLTEHGGVVGTIDYVSPEYLERGQVDTRSDIYALGVLAYEMITGQTPFQGKSVIETMTLRLRTDPEPPNSLRRDCSDELSRIVMKALRRDPELRYQAATEMFHDLERVDLSGESYTGYGASVLGQGSGWASDRMEEKPTRQLDRDTLVNGKQVGPSDEYYDYASDDSGAQFSSEAHPWAVGEYNNVEDEAQDAFIMGQSKRPTPDRGFDPISASSMSVSQSRINVEKLSKLSSDKMRKSTRRVSFSKYIYGIVIVAIGFTFGLWTVGLIVRHVFGKPF